MRGKHNIQYIWCELFPEDCLSLIVHLQPKYSDAGQPASSCFVVLCEPVPWWRKKRREREREGARERVFFAFHKCPILSSLLSLNTQPLFTSGHSGACYTVQMLRCSCRMRHCHSSRGLTQGCIASLHWDSQMTALPDTLRVRHPAICVVRMSNTLSSQQKYLGREAFLGVGARLSCMSTLNFAVRCEPG